MFLKTTYLFAFLTFFSSAPVLAGAQLDIRMDHVSRSGNKESGIKPSSAFQIQRARLLMKGNLGELNEYTVRLHLLNSAEAKRTRDAASTFIDYAFIKRKLSDELSLSVGKIILGMGGIEATINPADYYLVSVAGGELSSIYWAGGAALEAAFDVHNIKLAVANLSEDVFDAGGTTLEQSRHLVGLVYTSKLMDGMIQPNLSYYSEKFESSATSGTKDNSYLAAGARLNFEPITLDLDYLNNKFTSDPKVNAAKVNTNSIIANLRYGIMEASSILLKLESSTAKTLDTALLETDKKVTGTTLAYEYKPSKEENWRAHVAVTQASTKPATGDTKMEQKLMVGMRMVADILK